MLRSFGITDKGKVRKDNQDSFIIEKCEAKNAMIVALCDGMGGAKAGGLASQISNKAFVSYIYAKLTSRTNRVIDYARVLKEACAEANGVAYEYSLFDEAYNGMGSTIVGGVIKSSGSGYIINVGDSRAYHISRKSNSIYQISRDHSLVEELVEVGAITKEQAKTHPQKNVITRALGVDDTIRIDYSQEVYNEGDIVLLCSDGLTNFVDESTIHELCNSCDSYDLAEVLVAKANENGGGDNVTVVTVTD